MGYILVFMYLHVVVLRMSVLSSSSKHWLGKLKIEVPYPDENCPLTNETKKLNFESRIANQ